MLSFVTGEYCYDRGHIGDHVTPSIMGAIVTMGAVTDTENQEADNRDIVTLYRKPLQPPSWS